MINRSKGSWIVLVLLSIAVILGAFLLTPRAHAAEAQTQPEGGQATPACNNCHDALYFNYDYGKAYCVGAAHERCVDCHFGDPTALQKTAAHKAMVAHPVKDGDDSNCRSCHPDSAPQHVDQFARIAGFREVTYLPEAPAVTGMSAEPAEVVIRSQEELSWQLKLALSLGALFTFGGALLVMRRLKP